MIRSYVSDIAVQMGIQLSDVRAVDGRDVGCPDVFFLHLAAGGQTANALVYQTELDGLRNGSFGNRLEPKIRGALSRLQIMLEQ